ncbi:AAA family ATPase [Nocardioides sp. TF02-7]|uniref:AAA family ATPase n=1 Tax=Nocardioides sp. TF02-7 TaxID=2917724 RepID=UPI001F0588DC|nr:AAA family ATPase [Nocardioides sp. TF02-7]UMG91727.1 AAA family ATPase [Nocardioides sp. TF02-7]
MSTRPPSTTVLAVANQKGGVAKTTSVASIGAALAELGQRVLLVDLDPQACLTFSLGIDPEDLEVSVHHVLTKGVPASEVIIETEDGVDLLPATIELARAEADLLTRTGREHVVRGVLEDLGATGTGTDYDWVLLDCPPSLGVLTVAALTAADGVLVPLQCETLSHRGVGQLLDTVHDVRRFTNRDLAVWGVLPTLYDGRTNHARTVLDTISGDLRPRGRRAADPQDDQVRRGAGGLAGRSSSRAAPARAPRPTARSPPTSSGGRRAEVKHARQPGQHRAQAGKRRAERPGRRRAPVRPRYPRLAVLAVSATVAGVALVGNLDVLPGDRALAGATTAEITPAVSGDLKPPRARTTGPAGDREQRERPAGATREKTDARSDRDETPAVATAARAGLADESLPPGSGSGHRVVFSEGRQRVWLVDDADAVVRTYPVSGSVYDNLDPGTYEVFSTSRHAVGIDDSGTMEYFVRFTYGDAGAAIGFHTIPVDDGRPVQTEAQLGTPLSHGCIRQREEDAIALWDFAPLGTTVVVTP